MLKKRIIGVITVRQGLAVQSFGYKNYLPLGKPEILAENLDRWGVDEILLQCINCSIDQCGPDFELIERLGNIGLSTPIIYAGGIQNPEQGIKAIKLGADRICVDALLNANPRNVAEISNRLGAQAIIAAFPLILQKTKILWADYQSGKAKIVEDDIFEIFNQKLVSEILLIDKDNEGYKSSFNMNLIEQFPIKDTPLIAFGGLSETIQIKKALKFENVVAVAIGNFLNYQEHSVRNIKMQIQDVPLRMPIC